MGISTSLPRLIRFGQLVACLMMVVFLVGCADLVRQRQQLPEDPAVAVARANRVEYEVALRNFRAGDYPVAQKLFHALAERGDLEPYLLQKTRYGWACSALALAATPEDLDRALAMFTLWRSGEPPDFVDQDARMLAPALEQARLAMAQQKAIEEARRKQTEVGRRAATYKKKANEKDSLLADKEAQLAEREAQLAEREATIARLRQQIEELDAVHRSIQQKKKELGN